MCKLVLLVWALLLCGAVCHDVPHSDLRRKLLAQGPSVSSGSDGMRGELRAEKMSDAALATHEAILSASTRGQIKNAASLGFKLASAAADPSVGHGQLHRLEGNRRLLSGGQGMHSGSEGSRADTVAEKISDAALGTHAAIMTASSRGQIKNAATLGFKVAAAAADPSVNHKELHKLEGNRHLLAGGVGMHGGSEGSHSDTVAEKISDAALSTHEAILGASNRGQIENAASLGFKMASAAADPSVGHGELHRMEGNRHLLSGGMGMHSGSEGSRADTVAQKMSDAALSTHEAILGASNRGQIERAAALGFKVAASATDPTVSHKEQHDSGRRLAQAGTRSDMGTMDTALAASAAITKAVNTPSRGSTKFATDVGTAAGHVMTRPHSGVHEVAGQPL